MCVSVHTRAYVCPSVCYMYMQQEGACAYMSMNIDLEDLCAGQSAHICQIQLVSLHILESWEAHAQQQTSPVLMPASCFRPASPIGNKNTRSVTRGWQEQAFSTKDYVWE